MRVYIVTGISRGLGRAIVEELLAQEQKVIGIGRKHDFADGAIDFLTCDLSDAAAVEALEIKLPEADELVLINNAGILGNIGRISEQETSDLERVMQVNVFAPMALTRKLLKQWPSSKELAIVNISSGAANRSIPSWAAYCASKAALNRLSENVLLEERELQRKIRVFAVAPGVIDTDMQGEIRNVTPEKFSSVGNFIRMKSENELATPSETATKILQLLDLAPNFPVICDVREL